MTGSYSDWKARAAALAPETRMYIDGTFVEAASGARFETITQYTQTKPVRVDLG